MMTEVCVAYAGSTARKARKWLVVGQKASRTDRLAASRPRVGDNRSGMAGCVLLDAPNSSLSSCRGPA